jgi:hypothetical protein
MGAASLEGGSNHIAGAVPAAAKQKSLRTIRKLSLFHGAVEWI